MCSTPSTSSGTAIGSRSSFSSGSQYALTSTPRFGWVAFQCRIPGAISSIGVFCNKSCKMQEFRLIQRRAS